MFFIFSNFFLERGLNPHAPPPPLSSRAAGRWFGGRAASSWCRTTGAAYLPPRGPADRHGSCFCAEEVLNDICLLQQLWYVQSGGGSGKAILALPLSTRHLNYAGFIPSTPSVFFFGLFLISTCRLEYFLPLSALPTSQTTTTLVAKIYRHSVVYFNFTFSN